MKKKASAKPKLLIMASWRARSEPNSPLLRFVRDHATQLKEFEIHATEGTYHSILATGLYTKNDVNWHRAGPEGGVVELAAMVARKDCEVFIFLSDPKDRESDVPENRALQRLCKELKVRLINTLAGAEQWALYEATMLLDEWRRKKNKAKKMVPAKWKEGHPNVDERGEPLYPAFTEQTLSLISHDGKKEDMVLFVNKHHDFLSQFHRILTTGTTGYLLKLLFADEGHQRGILRDARRNVEAARFRRLEEDVWVLRLFFCNKTRRAQLAEKALLRFRSDYKRIEERLEAKEKSWTLSSRPKLTTDQRFVNRIFPLASGPQGGDVLIASEVLNNKCHAVVFFQDPGTAQPHDPDIRLFERTCQFWSREDRSKQTNQTSIGDSVRQSYATCVSDPRSADEWASHMKRIVAAVSTTAPLAHRLRRKFRLRDVVIVDVDSDSENTELGKALARACAGYLHRRILATAQERELTRIGIGHGWTIMRVLEELKEMRMSGLLRPVALPNTVVWSTLVGNLTVVFTNRESAVIANEFQKYYGGDVEAFQASGFVDRKSIEKTLPSDDQTLIKTLSSAELIIVSAAPWNSKATLVRETLLSRALFPAYKKAVGTMSVLFLREDGSEVLFKYSAVGLGHEGFASAARRGAVILVCGGAQRRKVALAALKGKLVSVLVTTNKTAEALLRGGKSSDFGKF